VSCCLPGNLMIGLVGFNLGVDGIMREPAVSSEPFLSELFSRRIGMRKVCDVVTLVLTLSLSFAAVPLKAHEFWIDPVTFTPKLGATVPIVFRIGSDFLGGTYPFVRALNSRLALHDAGGKARSEGDRWR
jgi:hypothetical protein